MLMHKLVANKLLTMEQLHVLRLTKGDCFEGVKNIDYALPQDWLNDFSNWCKSRQRYQHVTYDMILSTTVWSYPTNQPMTCCAEVHWAYSRHQREIGYIGLERRIT